MEISFPLKRRLIQLAAFLCTDSRLQNLPQGKLSKESLKEICSPGLNCYSCPAASFACPIGALQTVGGATGFSFYVTGSLLLMGLIFGRAVCGFLCPFGLLQDLLHKLPGPKLTLSRSLACLRYVLLAAFVIVLPLLTAQAAGVPVPAYCKYICPAGTLEAGIPLILTHPEYRAALGWLFYGKLALLVLTLAGCVLIFRFFCRLLCPLGAIYGLMNPLSFYRLQIGAGCTACGHCAKICPMEVDPRQHPGSAGCIRCGKCAQSCPAQAIRLGFALTYREQQKGKTA